MLPELAQPGSLVFEPTSGPVPLTGGPVWWHFRLGASWRTPTGPGSSIAGLEDHPVVHIAHADAEAYAKEKGIAYEVTEPHKRKPNVRVRGYGENFATDRRGVWTH